MTNKRFYWLKISPNFFSMREVRKMRRMAGGDQMCIIYMRSLLLSLETSGRLFYEGVEDSIEEEIAYELNEPLESVKMTFKFLEIHNLLINSEDCFQFLRVDEMTGSETDKARIMRKSREKRKLEEVEKVTMLPSVTKSYPSKSKSLDIDIELDKYKDIYNNMAKANGLSTILKLSDIRKKSLKARLKEYSNEEIVKVIELVSTSDFLTGRKTDWKCNFDWIFNKSNFLKILEGSYNNEVDKSKVNYTRSKEDEAKEEDYYIDEYGDKWIGDVRVFDNN